jgi:hypothetical protein
MDTGEKSTRIFFFDPEHMVLLTCHRKPFLPDPEGGFEERDNKHAVVEADRKDILWVDNALHLLVCWSDN